MALTTRLGRTELVVPTCGFGGIPVCRDHLTDDQGADIVRRAIDAGLVLVDTFSRYGRSEIRIGRALAGRREKVTLVTKSRASFEPADFEAMVHTSLENLRVECIDILLLKNLDNDERLEKVPANIEVLDRLREQGKIRFTGLSAHSPDHAYAAIETGLIDVAEVPVNYANPHFEKVLDVAAARDVGILAMKPLGGGRLFADGPKGSPETLDTLVNALSYAMSHASNPALIPGIGSQAELDRYLEAIPRLRRLDDAEKKQLADSALNFGDDFCRACGYCRSVCPSGIPIDEILPLLDRAKHVRTDGTFRQGLRRNFEKIGAAPNACEACRKCIEECPYDLPIPERLKEAFEVFAAR